MIKGNKSLSESASKFYELISHSSPDLLIFASVESPSDRFPYLESDTIVLVIPAREGFLFDTLFVEVRKDDILITMGIVPHRHISWWSEDSLEKQMNYAIQFIKDIIDERVIFVKRKVLIIRKTFYEDIRVEELEKTNRVLEVYSWQGTYDRIGK